MLTALSLAHRARLIVESIARAMALVAGWSFLAGADFVHEILGLLLICCWFCALDF